MRWKAARGFLGMNDTSDVQCNRVPSADVFKRALGRQGQKQGDPLEDDCNNPHKNYWGLDWRGGGNDESGKDQNLDAL